MKTWKDISIKEFQDIILIMNDLSLEELDKNIKILSIILKKSENELYNSTIHQMNIYSVTELRFLQTEIKSDEKILDVFKIKNRKFKLQTNLKKMNVAQYIDTIAFHENKKDYWKNLHYIVANYLTEVSLFNRKIKDQDVFEIADFIKDNMNIVQAKSIADFFLITLNHLSDITTLYMIQTLNKMIKKEKNEVQRQKLKDSMQNITTEFVRLKSLRKQI